MRTRNEAVAELTAPSGEFPLESVELNGVPMRVYKNAPRSLRDLFLATKAFGDRPFLIYESTVLTFNEHFRQVAALAAHLKTVGVEKGDRVAIGMRNYPEWVTSFWACQVIGAVAVALNAWWTGPELEYGIEDSGSKVLIADRERMDRIEDRLAKLGIAESIVVRGSASSKSRAFADVVANGAELPAAGISPEDYSTIL